LFVPVLPGLERLTAEQAESIGHEIRVVHGGIEFRGDLASIYRANLAVRTGNRVLLRLGQFLSQSYPMLYNHARRIDWPAVLGNCPEVSIDVSARESRLNHKEGIRQAVLDAIRCSMAEHQVETVLVDGGPLTVKARLYQDRCTLSLDTSGEHLHKRGYRSHTTTAPIRETTAAGMLLLAQSKSYDVIVDPFCGSGTFAIEAELLARNYPPGLSRSFAIENSPLHSAGTLRHTRRQLLASASDHSPQTVLGFDISPTAIQSARFNASMAPTTGVKFGVSDALALDFRNFLPKGARGLIVANLPYGFRLGTRTTTQSLERAFCSVVARTAVGWDFLIIMPEADSVREPGLLVERTLSFSNGGIPVVASLGRVEAR
jgi:putative N6-adenine-specific DNA methylase